MDKSEKRAIISVYMNWYNYVGNGNPTNRKIFPIGGSFYSVKDMDCAYRDLPKVKRETLESCIMDGVTQSQYAKIRGVSQPQVWFDIDSACSMILKNLTGRK